MTIDSGAGPGRKTIFNLRFALMVSLALNVLIIGAVAGAFLMGRHHHGRGHWHKGGPLAGFARTLPDERGDVLRQQIESNQTKLEPLRKEENAARDEARSVLMTEPFDIEKFKAALARKADADAREKRARMEQFAEMVATLTPEERRQLHAWFEKRHKRRDRDRSGADEDAPAPSPPDE
jgi:uncharacterized membrane protein